MQDFQSIPGLARRVFSGGADLRRLRGYPGPGTAAAQQNPVKCPRCDSTNTKFCYYNNYNLSQPRHFCKSCRRYWTKGGVLRNVPVGGGCRKSKRSSSSSSKSSSKSSVDKDHHRCPSSATRSSSDSSSLTANTSAAADGTPSTPPSTNPATSLTHKTSNSTHSTPVDPLVVVDTAHLYPSPDILPEPASAGSFTGPTETETATGTPVNQWYGFSGTSSILLPTQRQSASAAKEEELRGLVQQQGFMNPTVAVDLWPIRGGDDGVGLAATATLDWSGSVDSALFDLASAIDPATAYWSQSHWGDTDPSFYLP